MKTKKKNYIYTLVFLSAVVLISSIVLVYLSTTKLDWREIGNPYCDFSAIIREECDEQKNINQQGLSGVVFDSKRRFSVDRELWIYGEIDVELKGKAFFEISEYGNTVYRREICNGYNIIEYQWDHSGDKQYDFRFVTEDGNVMNGYLTYYLYERMTRLNKIIWKYKDGDRALIL